MAQDCHELCAKAFVAMFDDGATKHVSYIAKDELDQMMCEEFRLPLNLPVGLIPKVTIEWVDAKEAQGA
jgi:hypothetical protein